MNELNEQIKKIIEENLPKQLGETLQKRLNELEKVESDLKDLKILYDDNVKTIKNLQKELADVKGTLAIKENFIKENEDHYKKVSKRDQELEVEVLKIKLAESEKRSDEMKGLVSSVFHSPVYREHISKSLMHMSGPYNPATNNYEQIPSGEISNKEITQE